MDDHMVNEGLITKDRKRKDKIKQIVEIRESVEGKAKESVCERKHILYCKRGRGRNRKRERK